MHKPSGQTRLQYGFETAITRSDNLALVYNLNSDKSRMVSCTPSSSGTAQVAVAIGRTSPSVNTSCEFSRLVTRLSMNAVKLVTSCYRAVANDDKRQ